MASFPSAALQYSEQNNPINQQGNIVRLQGLMQNNKLGEQQIQENDLKLKAQQQAQQEQQVISQALAKHGGNIDAALPELQGHVSPATLQGLSKFNDESKDRANKLDADVRAKKMAQHQDLLGLIDQAQALPPDQYGQLYPQIAAKALEIMPELKGHIDPATAVPQQSLGQFKLGIQTDTQYLAAAEAKQKLAAAEATAAHMAKMAPAQEALAQTEAQQKARVLAGTSPTGITAEQQLQAATTRRGQDIQLAKKDVTEQGVDAAAQALTDPKNLTALKDIASLRSDQRLMIFKRAREIDPNFDPGVTNQRIKFLQEYEDPKGRSAINRQAINNVLQHAGDLSQLNQEYRRSNMRMVNTPMNAIARQFGNDAYTKFSTTNSVLKDELALYFAGGYAPTPDQQRMWDKIQSDTATPAQTEAFAKEVAHLGLRRATTFNSQFKHVMGYDDPNMIIPEAKNAAEALGLGSEVSKFGSGGAIGGRGQQSAASGVIYARDPQGKLHQAPAGTALPAGWKQENK